MLDLKGADAARVVLVIGIMTLHAFGEDTGVGVFFVGSRSLSQGLLVTLAIVICNETKTVKDGRKFGCYIKEKEKSLDIC